MKSMKIIMYDSKPFEQFWFDKLNDQHHKIKYIPENLTLDNVSKTKGFDAVCAFVNTEGDAQILKVLAQNGIKYWFQRSMGYNRIDLKVAAKYNIKVFRVSNYSAESVAEHALALMMSLNRKLLEANRRVKNWNFSLNGLEGKCVHESTVGVIGSGKIGQCFIKIMNGMGAKVLVYDEYAQKETPQIAKDLNFEFTDLNTLLKNSDFISLHAPLLKSTFHMINDQAFKLMTKKPLIINCSRGELIDTKALIKALKTNLISGAGLDVLEHETNRFYNDLSQNKSVLEKQDLDWKFLLNASNVLVTGHQAFLTNIALKQIAMITLNHANEAQKGNFSNALELMNDGKIKNG